MSEGVCKNCGHRILFVNTDEGKSFWFHAEHIIFEKDYDKNKVKGMSWENAITYCGVNESMEGEYEINGETLRIMPFCGCKKAEPKEELKKVGC